MTTRYASIDATTNAVTGWFDTAILTYPDLDLTTLTAVPDDVWDNRFGRNLVFVDGAFTDYVPPGDTLAQVKSKARDALANARYGFEIAGVYFKASGASASSLVASDRDSQSKLIAAFVLASGARWQDGTTWKMADGTFVPLTGTDAETMALVVQGYVAACFARESALSSQIDAATDADGVAAVDQTAGWPSQGNPPETTPAPSETTADTTETTTSSDNSDASVTPAPSPDSAAQ